MQRQIDDGLSWCAHCDRFGYHVFCGQCGARFVGDDLDWRECPGCHLLVSTDYCAACGRNVVDDYLRAWEDGSIDMEAESEMCEELLARWEAHEAKAQPAPGLAAAALAEFGHVKD